MALTRVQVTEDTFINGTLVPAGGLVDVDLDALGIKSVDDTSAPAKKADAYPIAPNLVKAGKGDGELAEYAVAAIALTGPNPTAPQAVPPGTKQIGEAFVAPGDGDSAGNAITAETTDTKGK